VSRRAFVSDHDPASNRTRVFIVSASIGGGHDGAAAELARRVLESGGVSCTVDFLDQLPLWLGRLLRLVYQFQLRFAPGSYDALYRVWFHSPRALRPTVSAITALSRRRLARRIRKFDPTIVVSVYPLASVALGRMRAKGWLRLPAVTYLTDFAVHPLWVHGGVDLHLAISADSADSASEHGARHAAIVAPLVHPRFSTRVDRTAARNRLGFTDDTFAVLVVAGSWGVGSIEDTVTAIAAAGPFHPVCVCGRNDRLVRQLSRLGVGTILGWTDQMAELMTACDVVVENAGGLTCMEAVASGLPVITYQPIPGHGRDNARRMAGAGVVRFAHDRGELRDALNETRDGRTPTSLQIPTHREVFDGSDAAGHVAALSSTFAPTRHPIREPRGARLVTRCAVSVVGAYVMATAAFGVAAAHGLGVDRSGVDTQRATIVGIRLNTAQLNDAAVADALGATGVAAVVDDRTACDASRSIVEHGVTLVSIGDGDVDRFAWQRAKADEREAADEIASCTGTPARSFVALRRVTAFDWFYAHETSSSRIIAPFLVDADKPLAELAAHHLYVIDATRLSPLDAQGVIESVSGAIRDAQLAVIGASS
jgi:processive 1,2-diacylglycerol beta-glucosyltransferase